MNNTIPVPSQHNIKFRQPLFKGDEFQKFHYWGFISGKERLQTVPDNYTSCVSDSHAYRLLRNGWTVDVISHILKGLK